ncbi:MAG: magnesium transporter CorA family protein [Patescibacteria group bacterium]|nr:magnesium transporter CorA family protein [Patescibacteria group bacterium]
MKTKKIRIIKSYNLTWYDLEAPEEKEYKFLRERFQFHPLDIQDCISPVQRPKMEEYNHYIFLIVRIPFYQKEERVIRAMEIDIFVGQNYLVTAHQGKSTTLKDFVRECHDYRTIREKYFQFGPGFLLYEILNRMFDRCYSLLDAVGSEIDRVENKMFKGQEGEIVEIIAGIKRNVINLRKIMKAHGPLMKRLINNEKFFLNLNGARFNNKDILFDNLSDKVQDIWDILDGHTETIAALETTNENLISHRLNEIMKTLTIVSSILLPAALVTQIFGMSYDNAPLLTNRIGFIIVFLLIFFLPLTLILFFKKKKWL